MDFKKKAEDFMRHNTDYPNDDIALSNLEKALKETWNEAIETAAKRMDVLSDLGGDEIRELEEK